MWALRDTERNWRDETGDTCAAHVDAEREFDSLLDEWDSTGTLTSDLRLRILALLPSFNPDIRDLILDRLGVPA